MIKKNGSNDLSTHIAGILDGMSKEDKEILKKNMENFISKFSGKLDGALGNLFDFFPNGKEILKKELSKLDDTFLTDLEIEKKETILAYRMLKTMNFDLQKNYLDLLVIDYSNGSVIPKNKYHLALIENFIRKNDFDSLVKLKDYEVEDNGIGRF